MMRVMYKLVFSSIELLRERGYWYLELRAKSKKKLKRCERERGKKKKSHRTTFLCFTHLLTTKTCLEAKLLLYQETVWIARKAPKQVNRNSPWADWYFDPCLTFIPKASVDTGLTFSDSGESQKMLHLPQSL